MERELDFWVGEWDARWEGASGTNPISAELDDPVQFRMRFDREVPEPAWTDQWRIEDRRKR